MYAELTPASLPLVDAAMTWIRQQKLIAPPILTTERQVWHVQRMAQWRIHRRINNQLSTEQKKFLAELLQVDSEKGNKTPLAWLQRSSGKPSSDGMFHLVERITFLKTLDLPSRPENIHPVRYRQLAQRGERYRPQALANLKNLAERHALLLAFLHQQQLQLIDQLRPLS